MRFRRAGGLDLTTAVLLAGGVVLLAAAIAAGVSLRMPSPGTATSQPTAASQMIAQGARPAAAVPADRVAAVLYVNSGLGAGAAIRVGDRIDVLGYFASTATQPENTTRVLLQDVLVLATQAMGSDIALTLALQQSEALLVNEVQALGVRPFVTLPAARTGTIPPPSSFTDSDLAARLAEPR